MLELPFMKVDERAIEPRRAHQHDAGLDIFALEDVLVRPGEVVRVKTGIHIALSSTQVGLFWDKSGRASHGLTILGGCIDGPYRGELEIVVTNMNLVNTLEMLRIFAMESNKFVVDSAVKTAQSDIIFVPYKKALTQMLVFNGIAFPKPRQMEIETFKFQFFNTERGEKGFSSTDTIT